MGAETEPVAGSRVMGLGSDFDDFVNSYATSLIRAATVLTGDSGLAEDLVQTTLLRLARHWRAAKESPRAYAHRVLINLSRNHLRDLGRQPRVTSAATEGEVAEASDSELERVADRMLLRSALRQLPEQQREVAVMRFILDLSVAETATLLEIPEGTVKSATHRALASLRDYLDHDKQLAMEVGRAD